VPYPCQVVPPRAGRLRLGLWILATASAVPGALLLRASFAPGDLDLAAAAAGAVLLALTSVFAGTLSDIRQLSPAD
jgi:hypothetical protein